MQRNAASINNAYLKHYRDISKPCWIGISVNFVESILIGIYYFLSLYFVNDLHFSISTSGIILSCYGLGAVFGGLIAGRLSDKYPPRRVMAASLLLQALIYCCLIKSTSQTLLMIVIGLLGFSTYSFLTSNHLWILNQCRHDEAERLKVINILSMVSNLGLGISALLISYITHSYHTIFAVAAIIVLLLAFCLPTDEITYISNGHTDNQAFKDNTSKSSAKYNNASVLTVLLCVFLIGGIVAQIGSTYSIYIHQIFPHMQRMGFSILFAINTLLIVLLSVPMGSTIKNQNKLSVVGLGALLVGLGMGMLAFCYTYLLAVIACIIYTLGEIIFFSTAQLICYQSAKSNKAGIRLGMYRTTFALARIAGPVTGGLIYANLGSNMLWCISALCGISCYLICHIIRAALPQY